MNQELHTPKMALLRTAQPQNEWHPDAYGEESGGAHAPQKVPAPVVATGQCRQADAKINIQSNAAKLRNSWSSMRILNLVDERIMEACEDRDGCGNGIKIARSNIARLLRKRKAWRRPDSINADATSEILIVWRSAYGKVEIDTNDAGEVEYYVTRTAENKWREGKFVTYEAEEVDQVISWLDERAAVVE